VWTQRAFQCEACGVQGASRHDTIASTSPWHNWIARTPPKGEVVGSSPAGDAISGAFAYRALELLSTRGIHCRASAIELEPQQPYA
jgi:hypothetical protein